MTRIDLYLTENNIVDSRTKAQNLIKKGLVFYNKKQITKPSFDINPNESNQIEIKEYKKYVGRGAYKLLKAFDEFDIKNIDTCLDIGSSTGGFTQVLLEKGCKEVYAIDVGTDQMANTLRKDSRLHLFENTNFRTIDVNDYPKFDLIVCDVSFISLKMIIPNAKKMLKDSGEMILLIKPQFESKSKKHIIKDKKEHLMIIDEINEFLNENLLYISNITPSPIKGKSGNIEYLIQVSYINDTNKNLNFKNVVNEAFNKSR